MTKQITWTDVDARVRNELTRKGLRPVGSTDAEVADNLVGHLIRANGDLEYRLEYQKRQIARLENELALAVKKPVGKAKLKARVEKLEKAMAHVLLGFEADL